MVRTIFTLYFDGSRWVGLIQRSEDERFYVGRHVFGAEPGNAELLAFLCNEYHLVPLVETDGTPGLVPITPISRNAKRRVREARRLLSDQSGASNAHRQYTDSLSRNLETRKAKQKTNRAERRQNSYQAKCEKRKKKHNGR